MLWLRFIWQVHVVRLILLNFQLWDLFRDEYGYSWSNFWFSFTAVFLHIFNRINFGVNLPFFLNSILSPWSEIVGYDWILLLYFLERQAFSSRWMKDSYCLCHNRHWHLHCLLLLPLLLQMLLAPITATVVVVESILIVDQFPFLLDSLIMNKDRLLLLKYPTISLKSLEMRLFVMYF